MGTAGTLLKSARQAHGLTQSALAQRAGTYQPRIAQVEHGTHEPSAERLSNLLAATGQRLTALPTTARPAVEVGADIAGHLARQDFDRAFREVIQLSDDLARATRDVRVALVVTPPASTGDRRFDALLAGVVEHHLRKGRLPIPGWLRQSWRSLELPWHVDDNPFTQDLSAKDSLPGPLRHGVVLAASELASV
ncbi:MAG: helix-turn-helix transcriptional regulator [Sporichthyaceae bacterium]